MAMEPITLFARIKDLPGVARHLRSVSPNVEIDGPDDDWENAVVTFGKGRNKQTLTVTYSADYHAPEEWATQMQGMRGYFSHFPDTERKPRVMQLTTTFRCSHGMLFEPDFDPEGDERLDVLFSVAELLDGVLFSPSALRDAEGRILFSSDPDEEDPEARWPKVAAEVSIESYDEITEDEDDQEPPAEPPNAMRVLRRGLALTAVTTRAILEQDQGDAPAREVYKDLLAWIADLDIDDEFEPEEWEVLQRPIGRLEPQMQINSTWRLEGLVVLAWAMGQFDLPPHDQLVEFNPLWSSFGLIDSQASRVLLAKPVLRPRADIEQLGKRLLAVHWRLRNFSLNPKVMDFGEFAKTCWFGPLDLRGLTLVKGDLAVGGKRIDKADPDAVATAHSAAQERHQAVNWLLEGPARYSEASVAT